MSCPTPGVVSGCDYAQFLVQQTPKFSELIMEDIRPTDGWLCNVSTGSIEGGTPSEITQDRFRAVWPNTTKTWRKVTNSNTGCTGTPCDPPEAQIGWGADRLTYYAEEQTWVTPLMCFDSQMHVTHAKQHMSQIISDILKPATTAISSNFLRKRALQWAKKKWQANKLMPQFTYQWVLAGTGDEEIYFDCSCDPNHVFKLVPQMLQMRFEPLMRIGYGGKNPFKETAPYIELVTDITTCWELDHLGGSTGVGGTPSVLGNWRFEQWSAANEYWRYGYSGKLGNFMVRTDPMGLRFNYVMDLGAGANGGNGNRYRYQVVLPYRNGVTSGAGGASGLGSDENPDFDNAQFRLSYIFHKKAMRLLTMDATPINPEMPYGHRDFGGSWQFMMHDLGQDQNGIAITNKWQNKGQFGAWFKYYVEPQNIEFMEVFFHRGEPLCVPEITCCNSDPGYPAQEYSSQLPSCPLPSQDIPAQSIPPAGVIPTDTFQTPINQ
jgi:hypothetical protein